MNIEKILEKKELEAGDSDDSRVEGYKGTHLDDLVDFKGHTILLYEAETLEEIMQKYNLHISYVGFDDEHVTQLYLSYEEIKSIEEIPGLETLTNLQELSLSVNQITEISGLEKLTNLQILYLYGNQITEIKNLESLTNLKELYLDHNKLNSDSEPVIKSLRERGVKVWT